MDIIRRSIVLILFLVFLFSTQNTTFSLGMICKESERTALLSFKQHLEDPYDRLSSWSGENCCRWAGVVCNNTTDHVVQLQLHGLRLGGELNPSLQELKQLRHLDLSGNDFDGISIPDFLGSLQSLRYLDLSTAGFIGMIPHQLGNLSNLRYLDISYNFNDLVEWQGPIVAGNFQWLSHLSSLQHLDLSGVNIKNASNCLHAINMLPSLLVLRLSDCAIHALPSLPYVNFTSLAVLVLQANNLNSFFPEWLYSLTDLEQLDLSYNSLRISTSIGNLTKLTLLDFSYNQLEGEIPMTLGNLCKLQKLDLSGNKLKEEIWGFLGSSIGCIKDSLQSLDLKENQVEGEIPITLGNLCKLQTLDVSRNKLKGEILGLLGSSIGCLADSLQSLDLSFNQLSGPLPDKLGRLRNLNKLVLVNNKLNGSVPESLGNLSKLGKLLISKNTLEGVVSEIHFANLTNLQYLSMDYLVLKMSPEWVPPFQLLSANLGTCQLGPGFPIWLRTQKKLMALDLSRTGISGAIPTWFWNMHSSCSNFDLSHNELSGELPKILNASIILRSNQFNGQLPLVSPTVAVLDLSNNSFSGLVSTFLCGHISENNHLRILDLSDNLLSGDLSDCWVYWTSLESLRLAGNQLTGKIPSSMGSLLGLQALHLSNNNLSGELPSSLRNCTSLHSIDLGENGLTGILPIWLGESFPILQILRLRSNKFYDEIPLELCHLASIRILDIAHNDLRGSIPRCFNNFSVIATKQILSVAATYFGQYLYTTTLVMKGRELEYGTSVAFVTSLDLSKNSLSGEIPEELTCLLGLQSLNLSENRFTGKIPEKIGNMSSLESLDFSKNRISGVIPQSISGLSFMSYLNFSYNNLSGKIPSSTQLQSFNASSYIGNEELCGPPLKKCNGEEPTQKPGDGDREVEDEDWFEMKWFYMSMGVGFAVGFWVFWGVIVFKRSWRIAYFRFLDDMKDKLYLLF